MCPGAMAVGHGPHSQLSGHDPLLEAERRVRDQLLVGQERVGEAAAGQNAQGFGGEAGGIFVESGVVSAGVDMLPSSWICFAQLILPAKNFRNKMEQRSFVGLQNEVCQKRKCVFAVALLRRSSSSLMPPRLL